jgi:type II secretory pathway component HofQ
MREVGGWWVTQYRSMIGKRKDMVAARGKGSETIDTNTNSYSVSQIRIRIQIISAISDRIRMDIDIINMRLE